MCKLLALLLIALSAPAQIIDATRLGEPVQLSDWRFHAGDDAGWAAPQFDDSTWQLTNARRPWEEQGLRDVRGYFWLRTRLRVPAQPGPLSLLLSEVGPYDLFVNGRRIGGLGKFPPRYQVYQGVPRSFHLPPRSNQLIVVALRFWLWPQVTHLWGFPGAVFIGPATIVAEGHELMIRRLLDDQIAGYAVSLLYLLLAAGLGVLFLLQRDHSEYLWLAFTVLLPVLDNARDKYNELIGMPASTAAWLSYTADVLTAICLIEFVFRFLREPMPKWLRVYQFSFPLLLLDVAGLLHSWWTSAVADSAALLVQIPLWFAIPGIVLWRYWRGNQEAGLLAIPLFLVFLTDMLSTLRWLLWLLDIRRSTDAFIPDLHFGYVPVSPDLITHFLFLLSVAALILYRFQKTHSEQTRAQAELEAARSMQEFMVPTSAVAAGFLVESAYLPAQEVGGDFFQLFPGDDGSVLVVIGDVSGKGLKAAMLVSLILGLLRRTLRDTREPARILEDVNDLLAGQTDGRFATCCCALLQRDGQMRIANAGHLSPYCGGVELAIPGGLPLGLSTGVTYEQVVFQIPAGQRVLFLSDGVVEARNKTGELYGFERTRVISIETPSRIAETAQRFGQEDDITVLGIQPEAAIA